MPLHEYVCRRCSHAFEDLVSGDATPRCPACDAGDVERLLSGFAVGRSPASARAASAPPPCGSCGDPRGPGACAFAR